jgi:hypothetical protein
MEPWQSGLSRCLGKAVGINLSPGFESLRLRHNNNDNGVNAMTDEDIDIHIEKPSRAERWKRSIAARLRRQVAKFARAAHSQKEEYEAQERLHAKRLMEKQKKQKTKNAVASDSQMA